MPTRINHIALVVDDPESALRFWRDGLGLPLERTEDVPEQAAEVSFLPVGESHVELVRPTTTDSGLAKYLAKRGPGMHHVCVEVEDVSAMLERLKAGGFRLIDRRVSPDRRAAARPRQRHPLRLHPPRGDVGCAGRALRNATLSAIHRSTHPNRRHPKMD